MLASAWLGGHLSFGKGVGVNQTAFDRYPNSWRPVMEEAELAEGELSSGKVGALPVLLFRKGDQVFALDDTCSHRGCSLSDGEVRGDAVVCPCHGSTFRLGDGTIVKGPATAPQPPFEARIQNGKVEVRPRSS
jgi:nitrite reductase/ring-hydroxylating ferredoxin subunit